MKKNKPDKNSNLWSENSIGSHGTYLSLGKQGENSFPISAVDSSPCMLACPAGVNVKSYVSLISAGKFHAALQVVRERNPLPGICGRICTHPCEDYCARIEVDDSVAICALKRFVADYELAHPLPKPLKTAGTRKEKVAIIGSGPAGLTAAHDLAKKGIAVTIYEELAEPGGMLMAGIPAYRMPRDILRNEIKYIKDLGVKIKTNTRISGKKGFENLQNNFDAIFIAVGAHEGKKLGIPGENEYAGFLDAVTFLRNINFGPHKKPGDKIIVIGGGNSAIDAARTALRLNCSNVNIVYRRTRKEMPASAEEIKAAEQEGVKMHYLAAPNRVLGKSGKITGLECIKMKLGKPDSSGRRRPLPLKDTEFTIKADIIIPAVSQVPDLSFLPSKHKLNISQWKTFAANESTLATNIPGVFAGGDAVTGPSTVIHAIAHGHQVSESIMNYLSGEKSASNSKIIRPFEAEIKIDADSRPKIKREIIPNQKLNERKNSFEEVDYVFSEQQALAEASRCLRCGPCSECLICVPECDKHLTFLTLPQSKNDILLRMSGKIGVPKSRSAMVDSKDRSLPTATVQLNSLFPFILEDYCRGCSDCVDVCEYNALSLKTNQQGAQISVINEDFCRQCGTCVAVCSTGALKSPYYTQDNIFKIIDDVKPSKTNIIIFTCNWNGSRLDDQKYSELKSGPAEVKIIDLMCTGQIQSSFILRALNQGVDGILVAGCQEKHCHYDFGTIQAEKIMQITASMGKLLGIDPGRVVYKKIANGNQEIFMNTVTSFIKGINKKSGKVIPVPVI